MYKKYDTGRRKQPWTADEVDQLRGLLKEFRYTSEEIAEKLGRTPAAIERKAFDLGIPEKPLCDKGNSWKHWTPKELEKLEKWVFTDEPISNYLPRRSTSAAMKKLWKLYGTKNIEKLRKKIIDKREGKLKTGKYNVDSEEWVSVDEDLPQIMSSYKTVSIDVISKTASGMKYIAYYDYKHEKWYTADSKPLKDIVAWQSLKED